jgi:hypothetical protein
MVNYMNAFYALDDIKKRTRKYFNKVDGISDETDKPEKPEKPVPEEPIDGGETPQVDSEATKKVDKDKLDDPYIFKHFY